MKRIVVVKHKRTGKIFNYEVDVASYIRKRFLDVLRVLRSCRKVYSYMFTFTISDFSLEEEALLSISKVWEALRKRIKLKGFNILLTIHKKEFQKRGVLHFHYVIFVDKPIYVSRVPDWLKADLSLWGYGMTQVIRVSRPVSYVLSYLSKRGKSKVKSIVRDASILHQRYPNKRLFYIWVSPALRSIEYKFFRLPAWLRSVLTPVFSYVLDVVRRGNCYFVSFLDGFRVPFESPFSFVCSFFVR